MAENTSAHTEVPGGHGGRFPPFAADTFASQLVWFAVTFVAALPADVEAGAAAHRFDLRSTSRAASPRIWRKPAA